MGEIADSLGAFAEDVCEGLGAAFRITASVISLINLLSAGSGENSDAHTTELQQDFQEAEHEKSYVLDTIENCRKSIQASREIITKYRYQQFCPNAVKEIDDGIARFEKLLDAKLFDEALKTAQKVAEMARNYSDAVLASEKAWEEARNVWKAVRDMISGKIQQLNSDQNRLSLPSGEQIPFRLDQWADEEQIEEIKKAVAAEEPPQDWTAKQIQTHGQAVIDQLNQLITEAAQYCAQTYLRGQRSRELMITLKDRGWKYKGFRYENDNPKQDMILHFDSVTGDRLKAVFRIDGALKLTVSVKSNNNDYKEIAANELVVVLRDNGIAVNQFEWD